MNERDEVRLRQMLDEARRVRDALSGRERIDLDRDWMLSYAVQHALQIIGEVAAR